jgi:hypothetical protein
MKILLAFSLLLGSATLLAQQTITASFPIVAATQAATPTFSPAAGTYSSTQSVTISDTTPSSTIYYTTNGSTPTTASSTYSGAITVATTQTVQAIATAAGYTQSAVGSAAYTISAGCTLPAVTSQWLAVANANGTGYPGFSDSVGSNPASQSVSADAPTYMASGTFTTPYLTFNGTSDFLNLATSIPDANTTYSFHVMLHLSGSGYLIGGAANSIGWRIYSGDSHEYFYKVGTGAATGAGTKVFSPGSNYGITATYNTSTKAYAFYWDNAGTSNADGSGTASTESYTANISTLMYANSGNWVQVQVTEMDFYNGIWSSTDAATLATYDHCMGYN